MTAEATVAVAVAVMRQRLGEALTVDDVAAAVGYSPVQLHRLFRRTLGVTPGQELTRLRHEQALRLLAGTDLGLVDVCTAVGYASLGSWYARFAAREGCPPGRWRRRVRQASPAGRVRLCSTCGEWTTAAVCGPCYQPGPSCPVCLAAAGDPGCCTPGRLSRLVHVGPVPGPDSPTVGAVPAGALRAGVATYQGGGWTR